jgi:hypothetical protein
MTSGGVCHWGGWGEGGTSGRVAGAAIALGTGDGAPGVPSQLTEVRDVGSLHKLACTYHILFVPLGILELSSQCNNLTMQQDIFQSLSTLSETKNRYDTRQED